MNYRFRNAILGFFGTVDNKGFPDDGQTDQPPSLFARKLNSVREDYPDATYYTLMNIMDSHDTQRILWSLTPGQHNREEQRVQRGQPGARASDCSSWHLVQFTMPGAPTIYYGDEVGMTGADDPDDRRTFPWTGGGPYGNGGDNDLLAHYDRLIELRKNFNVFRRGEINLPAARRYEPDDGLSDALGERRGRRCHQPGRNGPDAGHRRQRAAAG